MNYVILVFAGVMLIAGAIILVKPTTVFEVMSDYSNSLQLHIFAVVVRLFLGIAFVSSAQSSKFPLTLEIMGWLFIAAAIVLSLIGRNRFKKMVKWALSLVPKLGRAIGVFAILFGALLVYAMT